MGHVVATTEDNTAYYPLLARNALPRLVATARLHGQGYTSRIELAVLKSRDENEHGNKLSGGGLKD